MSHFNGIVKYRHFQVIGDVLSELYLNSTELDTTKIKKLNIFYLFFIMFYHTPKDDYLKVVEDLWFISHFVKSAEYFAYMYKGQ